MYGATTTTDADEDEDQDQDQNVAQHQQQMRKGQCVQRGSRSSTKYKKEVSTCIVLVV